MKFEGSPEEVFNLTSERIEKNNDKDKIVILISTKETKEIRSLAQNKTFYKLFTDIGNHLGETKDDIHDMMLAGIFGTTTKKVGIFTKEVNNEKHTSQLSKEQGIKFIDTMLAFCKKYDLPITVTSSEIKSLYESYN